MTCRHCSSEVWAKGLCSRCYQRVRAGNSVRVVVDDEIVLAAAMSLGGPITAKAWIDRAIVAALDAVAARMGAA